MEHLQEKDWLDTSFFFLFFFYNKKNISRLSIFYYIFEKDAMKLKGEKWWFFCGFSV